MKKEWIFNSDYSGEKSLIKRLLYSRGIKTEDEIKDFINPLEMKLSDPYVFSDMEKTIERLSKAIDNNEKIVIYGDFDADGVTSTSILYKTFKYLGADVSYYIPSREDEGHGFNTNALIQLMTKVKPKVLISVDCGISDVEAVRFINSFKIIDVIITDHHEAPEVLPEAFAIINPKSPNSVDENLSAKQIEYLTYFAGCGVAFKVAQALLSKYEKSQFVYELLPLVAVGTVADIVPLLGENRYFVSKGLELISQEKHYGLTRLLQECKIDYSNGLSAVNIAFGIAPRINASGRLETVDSALKLLISENPQEIELCVYNLMEMNKTRQKLEQEIFEQADEMLKKEGNKNSAIVLACEDWHIGIIGIVASKLVEKYYKPVFLMSYNKEKNQYRCSARSIEGVPLYDVISANAELLDGFGGHKLAAGLSFSGDKTPFEIVKKALNETVKQYVAGKDLKPFISIDTLVELQDMNLDIMEQISKLEPFGASNPSPVFAIYNLKISAKKIIGSENNHLRLEVTDGTHEAVALWWGNAQTALEKGDIIDVAFKPQINEFNGNKTVQLMIEDIHSEALPDEVATPKSAYKIYDNRTKHGILPNVNDYLKTTKYCIKIFAESKNILDMLKPFKELSSNVFSRLDIPRCDVVMFFDYPADKQTLDMILDRAKPKCLHFMSYEPKIFDEHELLKVFNGMLKYASNNNNGKFELVRCASFLGKSVKIFEMLLNLYEELGFIKIKDKNSAFYTIEFMGINDITKILNSPKYAQIFELILECEDFQKSLLEDNLEELLPA